MTNALQGGFLEISWPIRPHNCVLNHHHDVIMGKQCPFQHTWNDSRASATSLKGVVLIEWNKKKLWSPDLRLFSWRDHWWVPLSVMCMPLPSRTTSSCSAMWRQQLGKRLKTEKAPKENQLKDNRRSQTPVKPHEKGGENFLKGLHWCNTTPSGRSDQG